MQNQVSVTFLCFQAGRRQITNGLRGALVHACTRVRVSSVADSSPVKNAMDSVQGPLGVPGLTHAHSVISQWCESRWGGPQVLISDEQAPRPPTNSHEAHQQNLNNQEAQQMGTSIDWCYSFLYLATCRFILSLPVSNQTLSTSTQSLTRCSLLGPGALLGFLWPRPFSHQHYPVLRV